MDYKEKGKLVTRMAQVIDNFGGESNIPMNHDYWDMKRRLRLMYNSPAVVVAEEAGVSIEDTKTADEPKSELKDTVTVIPSDNPFGF